MKEHKAKISSAILWIIVYLVGSAIFKTLSCLLNMPDLGVPVYRIIFVLVLLIYMQKMNALSYYGIRSLKELDFNALFYCIPFGLVVIANWIGCEVSFSWWDLLFTIDALCIGFNEEILFRGFVFKALQEKSKVFAIVVSSCAFGFIHIVNLIGGADVIITLMQIISSCLAGFVFSAFFYRTNNLIPCILCHGLFDVASVFSTKDTNEIFRMWVFTGIIELAYGIYLLRLDKRTANQVE